MTLAELKRKLGVGARFEIVEHRHHPECEGTIRQVTKAAKTYIYSKDITNPDSKWATVNDGKGAYLNYEAAVNWEFDGDLCKYYSVLTHKDSSRIPDGETEKIFIFSFRLI